MLTEEREKEIRDLMITLTEIGNESEYGTELLAEIDELRELFSKTMHAIKHNHWWVDGGPVRKNCNKCTVMAIVRNGMSK